MEDEPKKLDLFAEEPASVPSSENTQEIVSDKEVHTPTKMLFDDGNTGVQQATSEILSLIMQRIATSGKNLQPAVSATVDSAVLKADSSLDAQATQSKTDAIFDAVAKSLATVCSSLAKEANIEENLNSYADAERTTSNREEVYIHFMYDGICVGDYSGFVGDKLPLPASDELAKFFKDSPIKDELDRFVGWDSNGIAQSSADITAVLRTERTLTVVADKSKSIIGTVKTYDGAKTLTALTSGCKDLDLLTPLLVHYAIYATSKVVSGDTTVRIVPKTQEAMQKMNLQTEQMLTVVFALRPSDLGMDTQNMTKEDINSLIIQKVSIPMGSSVEPPSDELLSQHGLRLPFHQYYKWSNDLDDIQTNCVIKAIPLTMEEYSSNLIQDAKEMSVNDWVQEGMKFAHSALKAIKYPAIAFIEHKLIKEFEEGRKLRTCDFVFRKHNSELMLMKYVGVSDVVEVPAKVNGMYVKYIHPKAFSSGPFRPWHIFNKKKLFSTEKLGAASTSLTKLILPRTIKYLPAYFLHGLTGITTLVIPESVGEMSPNALSGSSLEEIYFNGNCPKGFVKADTDIDIFAHRKSYKTFFE